MKLNQIAFKALLVAGIVGTMLNADVASAAVRKGLPTAALPSVAVQITVVSLTTAQRAALASADGTTLAAAAGALIAAAPAAQRAELAKSIAAFVAKNKGAAAATAVLVRLVGDVPAASSVIIQVALGAAPTLRGPLGVALPAKAPEIAAAPEPVIVPVQPPAPAFSNPLTVSAN